MGAGTLIASAQVGSVAGLTSARPDAASSKLQGACATPRQTQTHHPNNSVFLPDEAATTALGLRIAAELQGDETIFAAGVLGAGKTTLIRGILRGLGVEGTIRSPTYTLVEPYATNRGPAFHLDLYRLRSPEELEFLDGRALWGKPAIKLVEWPSRAASWLPKADLCLTLTPENHGRTLCLQADSDTALVLPGASCTQGRRKPHSRRKGARR